MNAARRPEGFETVRESGGNKPAAPGANDAGRGKKGKRENRARRTRRQAVCAALYLAGASPAAGMLLAGIRLSPAFLAGRALWAAAAFLAVILLCFLPAAAAGVLVWRGRAQKSPTAAAAVGVPASGLFLLGGQVLQTQLSRMLALFFLAAGVCLAAGFLLFRRQVRETGGFSPGPKASGGAGRTRKTRRR